MVDLTWLTGDGLDEDDGGNDMTFAPVLEEEFPIGVDVCAFACSKKYIFTSANAIINAIAVQYDVFLIICYRPSLVTLDLTDRVNIVKLS